jgi:hypothetical protein
MDVCKLFLEKPQLRPYFYHPAAGGPKTPDAGEDLQKVEAMCDLMTSFARACDTPANEYPQ